MPMASIRHTAAPHESETAEAWVKAWHKPLACASGIGLRLSRLARGYDQGAVQELLVAQAAAQFAL